MKIIGLTGPSGSGKSTVSDIAKSLGYFVIDCDKVSREVSKTPEVLVKLEKAFGGVVKEGMLDRKALAKKAFSSKEKTEILNGIMLPVITEKIEKYIIAAEKKGENLFLLDAPTLFESGLDKKCGAVVAVLADEDIRADRLVKRDGLTKSQLKSRLKSSKSEEFFKVKTGHIIYNNGNLEDYKKKAQQLLKKLAD